MIPSVTIVLPLYNAERIVHRAVHDLLDVTQSITDRFKIILVDNGSTDDTYEALYELSRCYPQVRVLWQPVHSGLGTLIELIRARMTADRILVHDGVSPICTTQLGLMLSRMSGPERMRPMSPLRKETSGESLLPTTNTTRSSRRFAPVSTLTESMQMVHQAITAPNPHSSDASSSLGGFQWISLSKNFQLATGHSKPQTKCPTSPWT